MRPKKNVLLKPYTTFNIGGRARFFIEADNASELAEAVRWAQTRNLPACMLGGGSNVLISDAGFEGAIIKLGAAAVDVRGTTVRADAGAALCDLVAAAARHGLTGLERLAGIPGTVGGAIRGNAGAFGSEMRDAIESITALNTHKLTTDTFSAAACSFGYRNSFFKENPEWIIVRAQLALRAGDRKIIERQGRETIEQREKKHIQNIQSAGSCFINPEVSEHVRKLFEQETNAASHGGRVPAGWLINKAGLRGTVIGGAEASPMHPNYIINRGGATARDVFALIELIQKEVVGQFGVALKMEIQTIGTF
ncbi:MAG: UDP-N-acetylmuramate dehydrogenase [Patescibacteria group bacterium]